MSGWRPWRALRDQDHIEWALVDMPAGWGRGICVDYGDVAVILIDRQLGPVERLAVLSHELVHLERGGTANCLDVAKEERAVDRIVADRLVPTDELAEVIDVLTDLEGGVTVAMIADWFDVPSAVAELAMLSLLDHRAS